MIKTWMFKGVVANGEEEQQFIFIWFEVNTQIDAGTPVENGEGIAVPAIPSISVSAEVV